MQGFILIPSQLQRNTVKSLNPGNLFIKSMECEIQVKRTITLQGFIHVLAAIFSLT